VHSSAPRSALVAVAFLSLVTMSAADAHEEPRATLLRLDAAVAAAPADLELRLRRSEQRRWAGDLVGAIEDLNTASRLAPSDLRVVRERGLARHAMGAPGALDDLDRYLDGAGDRPAVGALAARAAIHEAAGRAVEAVADLDRAVHLAPTPDLCIRRGALQESLGRPADAARGYRDCADRLGGAVVLRLAAVRVERSRGEPGRALEVVDQLLDARPTHPSWLLLRADVLVELQRPAEARAARLVALAEVERKLRRRNSAQLRAQRATILAAVE
jgi:tetratricopeptide (TPR) repeat protein